MQKLYIVLLLVLTAVDVWFGGQISSAEASSCAKCPPCPKEVVICPNGTDIGYAHPCQCCVSCVIPAGGDCPYTGVEPFTGKVECEVESHCCRNVCAIGTCTDED